MLWWKLSSGLNLCKVILFNPFLYLNFMLNISFGLGVSSVCAPPLLSLERCCAAVVPMLLCRDAARRLLLKRVSPCFVGRDVAVRRCSCEMRRIPRRASFRRRRRTECVSSDDAPKRVCVLCFPQRAPAGERQARERQRKGAREGPPAGEGQGAHAAQRKGRKSQAERGAGGGRPSRGRGPSPRHVSAAPRGRFLS